MVGENNLHEIIVLDNPQSKFNLEDLWHWAYESNKEHLSKVNKYTDIIRENYFKRKGSGNKVGVLKILSSSF